MIAANVDCVVIVQSCHFDFNLNRLERYLVMVMDGGAEPCILLTKTDLVNPDVVAGQLAEIRSAGIAAPVVVLSNVTGDGVDDLNECCCPEKPIASLVVRSRQEHADQSVDWPGEVGDQGCQRVGRRAAYDGSP